MGSWQHPKAPVQALIFDMDGTMIDSLDIEAGELMRRTTGRTVVECLDELFQTERSPERNRELAEQKEALYREAFGPVFREVAGFTEFAGRARALGLKVGVGTAGDRHNIAFAFGHLQLPQAPHAVVGGDEGLPGKPEPAIFLEAAKRMGISPEACIVFEDAPFGIEAARRAGMRAVALCTSHRAEELAGPQVIASANHYLDEFRLFGDLVCCNFVMAPARPQ